MIENEINLIADKLGMTVEQVYQMNLQYQQFAAIQSMCILIAVVATFIVFMFIGYIMSERHPDDSGEWIGVFGLFMGSMAAIVVGVSVFLIFNHILLPIQFPEYSAMIQTMNQIQSFMP